MGSSQPICRLDTNPFIRSNGSVGAAGSIVAGATSTFDYHQGIREALASLPPHLREAMSNVDVVLEEEPPSGERLLGLYEGIPLTKRGSGYVGVLPDKITIYTGPLERLARGDEGRLRTELRRVVLHEVAHHFGISDERLLDLGRY